MRISLPQILPASDLQVINYCDVTKAYLLFKKKNKLFDMFLFQ